jgi:hypothetical protein
MLNNKTTTRETTRLTPENAYKKIKIKLKLKISGIELKINE